MKRLITALLAVFLLLECVAAGAAGYAALRPGARGDEVVRLQEALRSLGYSLTVDGKYGRDTRRVVALYQRAQGLNPDGVAGQQTLSSLYGEQAAPATPAPNADQAAPSRTAVPEASYATLRMGMRGTAVKDLQEALIQKGYQIKADGAFGRATMKAVRSFQSANKLKVDGVAGSQTLSLLFQTQQSAANIPADTVPYDYSAPDSYQNTALAQAAGGASVAVSLRRGANQEQIAYLQQALLKIGIASLETDGSFGIQTAAAVRKFQEQYGLPANGTADPTTLALLYQISGTPSDALLLTGINKSASTLSLKASARSSAAAVQSVPAGAAVSILLEKDGWYLVSYKHISGYVVKDALGLLSQPAPLLNLARRFQQSAYQLTGDHKADLLGLAFTQLGFRGGSSASRILDGTGPGGPYSKYGEYYQDPGESYCSYFISWSARQAGISEDIINNARDVDGLFYDAQQAFVYFFAPRAAQVQAQSLQPDSRMDRGNYTPRQGDLIYFLWDNAKARTTFSHIGIVYDADGQYVYTLEGAAGGSVDTRMYRLDDRRIVGYSRPKY